MSYQGYITTGKIDCLALDEIERELLLYSSDVDIESKIENSQLNIFRELYKASFQISDREVVEDFGMACWNIKPLNQIVGHLFHEILAVKDVKLNRLLDEINQDLDTENPESVARYISRISVFATAYLEDIFSINKVNKTLRPILNKAIANNIPLDKIFDTINLQRVILMKRIYFRPNYGLRYYLTQQNYLSGILNHNKELTHMVLRISPDAELINEETEYKYVILDVNSVGEDVLTKYNNITLGDMLSEQDVVLDGHISIRYSMDIMGLGNKEQADEIYDYYVENFTTL